MVLELLSLQYTFKKSTKSIKILFGSVHSISEQLEGLLLDRNYIAHDNFLLFQYLSIVCYIYIYIYIYIYMYACMYVCIYIYIYL